MVKTQPEKKKKEKDFPVAGSLVDQIRTNKVSFAVFVVLRASVILVAVRCAFLGMWESFSLCVLTLLLFFIPPFVEKNLKIEVPTALEILVYCFVYSAEILGEIEGYYVKIPYWDTILHTVNGFMFAAIGFTLVDVFNRNKRFRFQLSPMFLAVVAFCFSMTIGILWEFFEFGMDTFTHTDMQKDTVISDIYSVSLDPTQSNETVAINHIDKTLIETSDGGYYILDGYLDVGLIDTMEDLFVNFIGAAVFSVIGYHYIKRRGKGTFASQFIPQPMEYEVPDGAGEKESREKTPVP